MDISSITLIFDKLTKCCGKCGQEVCVCAGLEADTSAAECEVCNCNPCVCNNSISAEENTGEDVGSAIADLVRLSGQTVTESILTEIVDSKAHVMDGLRRLGEVMIRKSEEAPTQHSDNTNLDDLNRMSRVGGMLVDLGEPGEVPLNRFSPQDLQYVAQNLKMSYEHFMKVIGVHEGVEMTPYQEENDLEPMSKKQAMRDQPMVNNTADNSMRPKTFKENIEFIREMELAEEQYQRGDRVRVASDNMHYGDRVGEVIGVDKETGNVIIDLEDYGNVKISPRDLHKNHAMHPMFEADPYADEGRIESAIDEAISNFSMEEFLEHNADQIDPDEMEYSTQELTHMVQHYLAHWVGIHTNVEDFDPANITEGDVKGLMNKTVIPYLRNAGINIKPALKTVEGMNEADVCPECHSEPCQCDTGEVKEADGDDENDNAPEADDKESDDKESDEETDDKESDDKEEDDDAPAAAKDGAAAAKVAAKATPKAAAPAAAVAAPAAATPAAAVAAPATGTGAGSSTTDRNKTNTETGGSSPGGASTGGVGSGIGGAGTGGAATGGASTGGAGTVNLTLSGNSGTGSNGAGKNPPVTINISNVGGTTAAGDVASGDGPGSDGEGGTANDSDGGGGGGAAPDEPNNYSTTGKDAAVKKNDVNQDNDADADADADKDEPEKDDSKEPSLFPKKEVQEASPKSADEIRKEMAEVNDKITAIITDGGRVSLTDPLSVKLSSLRTQLKHAKKDLKEAFTYGDKVVITGDKHHMGDEGEVVSMDKVRGKVIVDLSGGHGRHSFPLNHVVKHEASMDEEGALLDAAPVTAEVGAVNDSTDLHSLAKEIAAADDNTYNSVILELFGYSDPEHIISQQHIVDQLASLSEDQLMSVSSQMWVPEHSDVDVDEGNSHDDLRASPSDHDTLMKKNTADAKRGMSGSAYAGQLSEMGDLGSDAKELTSRILKLDDKNYVEVCKLLFPASHVYKPHDQHDILAALQSDNSPSTTVIEDFLDKHDANVNSVGQDSDHAIAWLSNDEELNEKSAPGQEAWIKSNKAAFIKEYGKKKGLEVLYATANKRADESISELEAALNEEFDMFDEEPVAEKKKLKNEVDEDITSRIRRHYSPHAMSRANPKHRSAARRILRNSDEEVAEDAPFKAPPSAGNPQQHTSDDVGHNFLSRVAHSSGIHQTDALSMLFGQNWDNPRTAEEIAAAYVGAPATVRMQIDHILPED